MSEFMYSKHGALNSHLKLYLHICTHVGTQICTEIFLYVHTYDGSCMKYLFWYMHVMI